MIAILGQPTESNSVTILGISGTAARWVARDAAISVRFVNGQVTLKSFERPGGAETPNEKGARGRLFPVTADCFYFRLRSS